MRITFLLTGPAEKPIGGYKVIYEYANRLANDGYDVTILYPLIMKPRGSGFKLLLKQIYLMFFGIRDFFKYRKNYTSISWFSLEKTIKEKLIWSLCERNVPESDIYFASYYTTAYYLKKYKKANHKKFYFIQLYENHHVSDEELLSTWKFDLQKIVISKQLEDIAISIGEKAHLLPNGFDFEYFKLNVLIRNRNKFRLSMMYNPSPWKGFDISLKAVLEAKKHFPEIELTVFGAYAKPDILPDWVRFFYKPDKETHNKIYNESSIYIAASRNEGWGLTIGEAMICGSAVICTDIGGFDAMAIEGYTALTSKVDDVGKMSENIIKLIENNELRIEIAQNGNEFIKRFTWEKSYAKLKTILNLN